jgi:putative DNA primase/helicase
MMDFNDPHPQADQSPSLDREEIRAALLSRLESVLPTLMPAGTIRQGVFRIGDIDGNPGDSLEVVLEGDKAGLWMDRATNEGGDIFALIAGFLALNIRTDFDNVLQAAGNLLGRAPKTKARARQKIPPIDHLGPATGKWDYLSADGQLLAVVYRFDPPEQRKEFRCLDVRTGKKTPPTPRPLYNQPSLARIGKGESVILVEGEKSAQALIDIGVVATTAMNGAQAPVEKTDWSPLAGKSVTIWPDRDIPGWDYAEKVAQAVHKAGVTDCYILYPPEYKPEGWDAADAVTDPDFDVWGFLSVGQRLPVQRDIEIDPEDLFNKADSNLEDGIAQAFASHYGQDWRYCAEWGKWLVWTGVRWNPDRVLYVQELVRMICRAAYERTTVEKNRVRLSRHNTIASVEKILRMDGKLTSTSEEWDADLWALNTPGGVVDLRSGALMPHRRGMKMTKVATATPRGSSPAWLRFLEQVTGGKAELMNYLQRMVGYCLTGSTREHALFFLYGTGANGKSVFLNTLATILGDYATNAPMDTFMDTRSERHPTDLAGLRGARLVSALETEQGRRWNEAKVKAITGGDTISARFMRQDFFQYQPHFKLVIAGNHKPSIRNIDEAMKRRLHMVPFTVTIPERQRDHNLSDKLLQERDGILAWAVEGCLLWQQHGLEPPALVVSATAEYFDEEDAIGDFLEEEIQRYPQAKAGVAEVFQRWQEWAGKRGEYVGTSRWLAQQLTNRGFDRTRLSGGAKGLAGLSLKPKEFDNRLPYID